MVSTLTRPTTLDSRGLTASFGTSLGQDVASVETLGYTRRDAVRVVARMTLLRADEGARYRETYLGDLHRLMVATA